jgi:hypothetical protein
MATQSAFLQDLFSGYKRDRVNHVEVEAKVSVKVEKNIAKKRF